MGVGGVFASIAAQLLGLTSLTLVVLASLFYGWKDPSKVTSSDLDKARRELWSLSETEDGLHHLFLDVSEGTRLHYLSSDLSHQSNLVIFLHGFPDSCHLFSRYLKLDIADTAFVSLDLPGYGGSDGLTGYGSDQVLNTLVKAFVELRRKHLSNATTDAVVSAQKCVLVSHDWGGVIAFRLAKETHRLFDRVIIMNSISIELAAKNIRERVSSAYHNYKKWFTSGFDDEISQRASDDLQPVLTQLRKSHYIFMFQSFLPVGDLFPSAMQFMVNACHNMVLHPLKQVSELTSTALKARHMAASEGPGIPECFEHGMDPNYGWSVKLRAKAQLAGHWNERIRLYSDGLAFDSWNASSEISHYTNAPDTSQSADGVTSLFQYPISIIFGMKDTALDYRIAIDGIEDYFREQPDDSPTVDPKHDNHILRLRDCGHWTPLESDGAAVLEGLLRWELQEDASGKGEYKSLASFLQREPVKSDEVAPAAT
ncbi:alpha/beta-hydrolase [Polychaeton citri CBS 116435]|uniref:Alpha/beta-hydrolase n=1 Tax=Polychaeton citri CBS 116435 TaxID=1314669 RepID=A0A9P4Q1U3_9PEZI|nr:alpha/beta-hydrolase [Polychaeton citri CBS 116435]